MPVSLTYPLDLTGRASSNRISNEVHTVGSGNRAFVLNAGPFYTQRDLIVRSVATGQLLFPDVDYQALHYIRAASRVSGLEVCGAIYIKNTQITGDVSVDYSCIGGEYSALVSVIQDILDTIDLNNGPVHWGQILDVPSQFPPVDHLQNINTLYGFDDLIAVVEGVRQAILIGDQPVHQMIFDYVNARILNDTLSHTDRDALYQALNDAIAVHKAEPTPHSKAQLGLALVQNWAPGTQLEHNSGTPSRYATTQGVKGLVDALSLAISGKVGKDFQIHTQGLISGGGDLGSPSNGTALTLAVTPADLPTAIAGINSAQVITPPVLKGVLDNRLGSGIGKGRLLDVAIYKSAGSFQYQLPATGTFFLVLRGIGGGAGGGGSTWQYTQYTNNILICSGGAPGSYGEVIIPSDYLSGGQIINISIGAGGVGAQSSNNYTGQVGGDTVVTLDAVPKQVKFKGGAAGIGVFGATVNGVNVGASASTGVNLINLPLATVPRGINTNPVNPPNVVYGTSAFWLQVIANVCLYKKAAPTGTVFGSSNDSQQDWNNFVVAGIGSGFSSAGDSAVDPGGGGGGGITVVPTSAPTVGPINGGNGRDGALVLEVYSAS